MRSLCLVFLFVLLGTTDLLSQQATQSLRTGWRIEYTQTNRSSAFGGPGFEKSFCYLPDSTALLIAVVEKHEHSLVDVNHLNQIMWQVPIASQFVYGISMFNDNVIVFYEDNEKEVSAHAALVDIKMHKILTDKILFVLGKMPHDVFVENTPSGKFDHLLIRTIDRKATSFLVRSYNETGTEKLEAIYFDNNLGTRSVDLTAGINGAAFLCTSTGENGNHFIVMEQPNTLSIKKYNSNGEVIGQLSTDFRYRDDGYIVPVCKIDASNNNALCLTIRYKNEQKDMVINTFYADFSTKKIMTTGETVLNKEYERSLKEKIIKNPGIKSTSMSSADLLFPVSIVTTKEKIFVIKEIGYFKGDNSASEGRANFDEHIILSIYDKTLKPVNELVLDRNYEAFAAGGASIGVHLKGNILYLLSATLIGGGTYGAVFYGIDANTGKLITNSVAYKGNFGHAPMEAEATLWFGDCFITMLLPKDLYRMEYQ